MDQDRERLAASDLLPSWDEIRRRLAENYAERNTLLKLDRVVRKAASERARLRGLAKDLQTRPTGTGG